MSAYTEHKAKLERKGYEQAMLDIVRKMQETDNIGGDSARGAALWIFDNTKPGDEAHDIASVLLGGVA